MTQPALKTQDFTTLSGESATNVILKGQSAGVVIYRFGGSVVEAWPHYPCGPITLHNNRIEAIRAIRKVAGI